MTKSKKPFAIRILIWFSALASAGMFLSILLPVRGIGPTKMGGERVTRGEWLHIAAPLVAVIGVLMALVAFGFAAQKHRSRRLVIAMFSLIIVYASILGALNLIHHAVMWRAIINATVFGAISVWYFYFKPNVAGYFRQLRDRHNL
jgi:hypothetical protein